MKAWVLKELGNLQLETVKTPDLKKNEVLVEVKAVGICGSDIPRIYKNGAYSYPLIPGHEFSGRVVRVGTGVDTSWLLKRVSVYPLIPCGKCIACKNRQYELCRAYSYLGSRRDGGFAEYVAVPQGNLMILPESVDYEEAAMMEPMAVAAHSVRRLLPILSEPIAVCGLGTIGMLVLMLLIEAGAPKIYAIGNKEFQKQTVLDLGLEEANYCNSKNQDAYKWLLQNTGGNGVSSFFECVGKNETVALGIDAVTASGKIMLIGNPYSDMVLEKASYWKILRNQLTIMGSWNSSFTGDEDDWQYMLKRLADKRIVPAKLISHRLSMDELSKGLAVMRNKTEDYIKIMVKQ